VFRHGPDFWQAMETKAPDSKRLRRDLRQYNPVLMGGSQPMA